MPMWRWTPPEMSAEGGFGAVGVPGDAGVNDLQVLVQGAQGEWGRQAAIESDETQVVVHPAIAEIDKRASRDQSDSARISL